MNLRELSKQVGFKTYQGKPCMHWHDGLRYVISDRCVDCSKSRGVKWSDERLAADIEKGKAIMADNAATNERVMARMVVKE